MESIFAGIGLYLAAMIVASAAVDDVIVLVVPKVPNFFGTNYYGITIGCFAIIERAEDTPSRRLHEAIHWEQKKELAGFAFLPLYLAFYLRGLVRYRSHAQAYTHNPFEEEAYKAMLDPRYLIERRAYAWRDWL
tara:strand:- start:373 stop:774 length:402 start_codon:yes stop_codon:yes gene_type:complete